MWKSLLDLVWKTLKITERTQESSDKIKVLQQQVEALGRVVQWQNQEIQRISEREQHEREKLELRLRMEGEREQHEREKLESRLQHERERLELRSEIERLRAERGLPPSNAKKESDLDKNKIEDKDDSE